MTNASVALDWPGDGAGADLAAHPARDDRREPARGTPGHDDQYLFRRRELGHQRVGAQRPQGLLEAAALGAMLVGYKLAGGPPDRRVQVLLHVPLGPALGPDRPRVLGTDHPQAVPVE